MQGMDIQKLQSKLKNTDVSYGFRIIIGIFA